MADAVRAARWTVEGRYELMGVNGSLLPAPMEAGQDAQALGASVIAGELRLEPAGDYRLSLTVRLERGGERQARVLTSRGRWRFLPSALDPTSGEVLLTAADGQVTSAAVTGVSLVHRTPGPRGAPEANWIYVRHWQTP
jgi:hypothetical protein